MNVDKSLEISKNILSSELKTETFICDWISDKTQGVCSIFQFYDVCWSNTFIITVITWPLDDEYHRSNDYYVTKKTNYLPSSSRTSSFFMQLHLFSK